MTDVLVVDDDFDIRDTIREVLADFGYEVAVASDGAEALAWLRDHRPLPRLVLLDWMMPRCDGASFRDAQQRDADLAQIPVVWLTAALQLEGASPWPEASGHLTKPVELETLLATVARFCRTESGLEEPNGADRVLP